MGSKRRTLSWKLKLPLMLLLFALVPLGVYDYWTLDLMTDTFETATLESVGGLANTKAEAVNQFTEDRRRDVERIAQLLSPRLQSLLDAEAAQPAEERKDVAEQELPELKDAEALDPEAPSGQATPVAKPTAEPEPRPDPTPQDVALEQAGTHLRQTLGLILWDQQEFEELLVIDAQGRVMSSTFAPHEGKTAAELDYYRRGLRTTFVQPVFMSPITERLTMVISTPIRDKNSQVIGVLAARLNLKRFFLVINDLTGLGDSGETAVGKLVDDEIVFMAPTRHDPQAALNRKLAIGSAPGRPLQEAARGQNGSGRVDDYRGRCTYAAWRHLPSLEWAMVTKVDCEEAMEAVTQARHRMIVFAMALFVVALLAALLAAVALVQPLQALKQATDRISRGDFHVEINIPSGDEIGDLADSFERMVAAIKFFRERSRGIADDGDLLDEPSEGPISVESTGERPPSSEVTTE